MLTYARPCGKIRLLTSRFSPINGRYVSLIRNYSSRTGDGSSETKKEFLCILPDKSNVSGLRREVKAGHYEGIKPLIASGKLVAGGALLKNDPVEGESQFINGSMVIYAGGSVEEVREIINRDIYATSGVWDLEKVQIFPYVSAVRRPVREDVEWQ